MAQAAETNKELDVILKKKNVSSELLEVYKNLHMLEEFTTQAHGRCIHIIYTIFKAYRPDWELRQLHDSINTTITTINQMNLAESQKLNKGTDAFHATNLGDNIYDIKVDVSLINKPDPFDELKCATILEALKKEDRIVLAIEFTYEDKTIKDKETNKYVNKGHAMGLVKLPKFTTEGYFYIDPNHPRIEFVTNKTELYNIIIFTTKLFYDDERVTAKSIQLNKLCWLSYSLSLGLAK